MRTRLVVASALLFLALPLAHHFIDLRVVEIGVGRTFAPSIDFSSSGGNATLFTINTGLVFHF